MTHPSLIFNSAGMGSPDHFNRLNDQIRETGHRMWRSWPETRPSSVSRNRISNFVIAVVSVLGGSMVDDSALAPQAAFATVLMISSLTTRRVLSTARNRALEQEARAYLDNKLGCLQTQVE